MENKAIVWVDVEASGRHPESSQLLELGAHLSTMAGESLGASFKALVQTSNLNEVIEDTDPAIVAMHDRSGLWESLWSSKLGLSVTELDLAASAWLTELSEGCSELYFGGNSIYLDRRFLETYLPKFYSMISHRSIDVTTLSLALQANGFAPPYFKGRAHRALPDALDSLDEYRHYLWCLAEQTVRE